MILRNYPEGVSILKDLIQNATFGWVVIWQMMGKLVQNEMTVLYNRFTYGLVMICWEEEKSGQSGIAYYYLTFRP
jgi:hypothetical protein